MPLIGKLAIALVVEVGYAVFTRVSLPQYFEGVELELYKTAVRAFTAISPRRLNVKNRLRTGCSRPRAETQ